MRIPALATVTICAALLAGGCSGGDEPKAAPAAPAAPAATAAQQTEKPTDAALSADTEAICDQASRTSTAFGKTVVENRVLLTRAGAESREAQAKAREKVTRDVQNFSFALLDMSKLTADAEVKKALATLGAQVTALKGDIAKFDDKRLTDLHGTLDKACGRG
ncbi:hypothetical protein [Actinoplanes utahensis]|uniref:Lipoprotein n=1 Tax=Actinoplanes utahensis TaxID=1869 RepID=A0A0A6UP21_ACTUT|nr:hypothetical protein [Actinoplanes utahensis]KHD76074.1 hypothetical protein MB27_19550 [Actinoplanes utahensis]GIF34702.1 hypothetical protein Aut01nite_76880 [Actinoplanes utahensis]